jgi:hypothetical protein
MHRLFKFKSRGRCVHILKVPFCVFQAQFWIELGWAFDSPAANEVIKDIDVWNARRLFEDRSSANVLVNVPHAIGALFWFLGHESFKEVIELRGNVFVVNENRRDLG